MFGFSGFSEFAWSEFPDIETQSGSVLEIEQIFGEPTYTGQMSSEPTFTGYLRVEPEI